METHLYLSIEIHLLHLTNYYIQPHVLFCISYIWYFSIGIFYKSVNKDTKQSKVLYEF